ncbi:hypothetical protein OPT61_g6197 [Boeremia exigua]|uniref:Uncharacterized protein n=1 Tax=Boeremia exigua TaxID=749465 RepID=A0ACC2I7I1_9PLEO|nr:hypothetical protein OPT61_g6197 [Boeremia exigua]
MIHLTRQRSSYAPPCVVDKQLTIHPILLGRENSQPALRWLGVWFNCRLTFCCYVATRTAKAAKVAHHIRSLARTSYRPSASSLRKATIACVYPSLLYGTECWYRGSTKLSQVIKVDRPQVVSAYVRWHIAAIDKALAIAARGILPAWRTTPTAALFQDAGLLPAAVALEEAKLRFAIASLLLEIPRVTLTAPHYSAGCQADPTLGIDKKTAAEVFCTWWAQLLLTDVTVFLDGLEQLIKEGKKQVTYGFAWAFLECHGAMETHDVSIKWAPGHLGIEGNKAADRLANLEAKRPSLSTGKAAMPTLSGIKTIARKRLRQTQQAWWSDRKNKLSR